MQMRPGIQIKSVIKALTDVVLPAVDPQNKLAQEQVRLAIGMLGLLAYQLPRQFRFDRDELARLIGFARDLRECARGGTQTNAAVDVLVEASRTASRVLEGARTAPEELEQQIRLLRSLSGAVIAQVHIEGEPACRDLVGGLVLQMSREQLLRDRALLISQGWEPEPDAVPAIDTLLEAGRGSSDIRSRRLTSEEAQ